MWNNCTGQAEKISTGICGNYNLTHAQTVCTRLSFPSRPAPSGEPGFEAIKEPVLPDSTLHLYIQHQCMFSADSTVGNLTG